MTMYKLISIFLYMAKRKKTLKVSVLGLDGAGKSTTVAYFTQTFYKEFFIIKMGRSAYYYDRKTGEKVPLFTKTMKRIDRLYEKYEKKQSKLGIVLASIFFVFATRFLEAIVIRKYKPDILIASRDITIDTLIYSDYYLPFLKIFPIAVLRFFIKLFSLFPKQSDLVIYLNLEPKESIRRIKKREVKQKIDPSVMRAKSRYRHENFRDLTEISKKYDKYLKGYMFRKKTVTVVYVDANKTNTKEKTQFCGKVIRSFIKKYQSSKK